MLISPRETGVCALIALSTLAGAAQASPWTNLDRPSLAQTCHYFENRARFESRGADMALSAVLADSCAQALHRFTGRVGTTPYEAKHARIYLERLTGYKSQVISMNMAAFATTRTRRPAPMGSPQRVQVSETGEYLIARAMGVLDSYETWARITGFRRVAD